MLRPDPIHGPGREHPRHQPGERLTGIAAGARCSVQDYARFGVPMLRLAEFDTPNADRRLPRLFDDDKCD
jgi:hypothetical protein